MILDWIRSLGKRIFHRTPFQAYAKRGWNRIKFLEDLRRFRRDYPTADYVIYDDAQLKAFQRDGFQSQYGQDHYLWHHYLSGITLGVMST